MRDFHCTSKTQIPPLAPGTGERGAMRDFHYSSKTQIPPLAPAGGEGSGVRGTWHPCHRNRIRESRKEKTPTNPCGSSVKIRVHPWRKKHSSSVANKTSVARTPTATNPYTCRRFDSHTRSLTIAAHCLSLQQQRNVIQPAQPLIRIHSW